MGHLFDADTALLWQLAESAHGSEGTAADETGNYDVTQAVSANVPSIQGAGPVAGKNTRWFVGAQWLFGAADATARAAAIGSHTVEAWVNVHDLSATNVVFLLGGLALNDTPVENVLTRLGITAAGELQTTWEHGAGINDLATQDSGTTVTVDTWTHVAYSAELLTAFQAVTFDGVNDYATTGGDVSELDFEKDEAHSISLWVRTINTGGYLCSKMLGAPDGRGWGIAVNAGGQPIFLLTADNFSNQLQVRTTSAAINDGRWHHLVITYTGGEAPGDVGFWIDKVEITSKTTVLDTLGAFTISNTASYNVMGRDDGEALGTHDVTQVAHYDDVLSSGEIALLYGNGDPSTDPASAHSSGLVGLHIGTGDTYPTLTDRSTNSNDLTMTMMDSGDLITDTRKEVKFYVGGTQQGSSFILDNASDGDNSEIYLGRNHESTTTDLFGQLASVHISDVARSASYISDDAGRSTKVHVQDGDTLALWQMEDLPEAVDLSNFGAHLPADALSTPPYIIDPIEAGLGQARWTDSTRWFRGPVRADLRPIFEPTADLTIEFWFKLTTTSGSGDPIFFAYSGSGELQPANSLIHLELQWSTRKLRLIWEAGAGGDVTTLSTNPLWTAGVEGGDFEAHHLAVTRLYNGSNLLDVDIYVDGVLVDDTLRDLAIPDGGTENWVVIGSAGESFIISDMRISDKIRTADEILFSYNFGVLGGAGSSSFYYKMRALANPGPGYVTWVVQGLPDFAGTYATGAIQAGTVVVAGRLEV